MIDLEIMGRMIFSILDIISLLSTSSSIFLKRSRDPIKYNVVATKVSSSSKPKVLMLFITTGVLKDNQSINCSECRIFEIVPSKVSVIILAKLK